MTKFTSPDELYQYIAQTIAMLIDLDLSHAAKLLNNVQNTSYTTGSEWLGELGTAIRAIEAEFSLPEDIQGRLDTIMTEVNKTWPKK